MLGETHNTAFEKTKRFMNSHQFEGFVMSLQMELT